MHKSLCVDCGHEKIMHTDFEKPDKLGECCAVGGYCQCVQFVKADHEGSDIRDAVSYAEVNQGAVTSEEARRLTSLEYDASVDSVVTKNAAEETMESATNILDGNTETLTADQLDPARISIPEGARLFAKGQDPNGNFPDGVYIAGQGHVNQESLDSMRPGGRDVNNGDIWQPQPGVILLWLDGHWLTPEAFNTARIMRQNEEKQNDPVNHPSHYTAYPEIEVIQLTRWMSFNLGNAVKYVARAGLKDTNKEIQDLEKAVWYIKDEIARKKGEYGTMQE